MSQPNSIEDLTRTLESAIENNHDVYLTHFALSEAYEKKGDLDKALEHFTLFHKKREAVFNKETSQLLKNAQLEHQTKAIQRETEKEKQKNLELKKAYNEIEKQRNEIAEKNLLVEKRNRAITDSIHYAKRIQEALLPSLKSVENFFQKSFILYKPKDIVCGDFYWVSQAKNNPEVILFAAVDCTGHGVPGAFMSVLGHNLLNQAINELGLIKPLEILNEMNKNLTQTLKQTYEESVVRDGMDLSMCSLDRKNNKLSFAGANNKLWIVRNSQLIEVKGDKFPVGVFIGDEMKSFVTHEIDVQKGDCIYIFTDGYTDQFGSENDLGSGKKFMSKRFRDLLISIHSKPFHEQNKILDSTFERWRGNLEQVDDVLVMGVRI